MSVVTQLGPFPGTISGLSNPPGLDAATMQAKLEQDASTLWTNVKSLIAELNGAVSTTIDYTSTDDELPSAKAVYDLVLGTISPTPITPSTIGAAEVDSDGKVKADQASSAIIEKTASWTPALAEAGRLIEVNSSVSVTCTIPLNSSVAFPVGTEIEIVQMGAGSVIIAHASGVTLLSQDNCDETSGQYAVACLKKLDTDTWLLAGALV